MASISDYQAENSDDYSDFDENTDSRGVRIAALLTVFIMAFVLSAFSTSLTPERESANPRSQVEPAIVKGRAAG